MVGRLWFRIRIQRVTLPAAGLSYYFLVGLLPILVLVTAVVGFLSRQNDDTSRTIIDELGVTGEAATTIADSVQHAEQLPVASSVVGLIGLLWAALAVTGALRRTVDAVWGVPDVGWTARLRSLPWALVAAILTAGSLSSTAFAFWAGSAAGVVAAVIGLGCTTALAAWFLAHLGACIPTRPALRLSTFSLTVGLEAVKYAIALGATRFVSRESLLYGSLGSSLGLLTVMLVTSWLLLLATALAAELTLSAGPVTRRHKISKRETRMNDQGVTAAVMTGHADQGDGEDRRGSPR